MSSEQSLYDFPVIICRKISTPENEKKGVTIYVGQAPVTSFSELPDEENVRKYTVGSGERKRRSGVHLAIYETLTNTPDKFSILNGGICIVTSKAEVDKNQKNIQLFKPSIINGSQTRGVIKDFISDSNDSLSDEEIPTVKFELLVTDDEDLITEASIARNNQIAVKAISILGARDVFSEMDTALKEVLQNKELRKSETDRGERYIQTEKLLQVIAALIPKSLWKATGKNTYAKAFSYTGQAGPLKLFEKIYNEAHTDNPNPLSKDLYDFYIDIAPDALALYEKWHSGRPFEGKNWRQEEAVVRDKETKEILYAHDGIIFPIIAAHSEFIIKKTNKWVLEVPEVCDDDRLLRVAHEAFKNIAAHKPHLMGRSESCYSQVRLITETINSFVNPEKTAEDLKYNNDEMQ